MRGYKALNKDMSTLYRNMIYELNKEYTLEGKLIMCENGYHFCNELFNVYNYYSSNSRIFEIDTLDGEIIKKGDKYCTNKIKIIREISEDEINKYIEDNFDKLINNPDPHVRAAVAEKGYGLDKLINDKDWWVRIIASENLYENKEDK